MHDVHQHWLDGLEPSKTPIEQFNLSLALFLSPFISYDFRSFHRAHNIMLRLMSTYFLFCLHQFSLSLLFRLFRYFGLKYKKIYIINNEWSFHENKILCYERRSCSVTHNKLTEASKTKCTFFQCFQHWRLCIFCVYIAHVNTVWCNSHQLNDKGTKNSANTLHAHVEPNRGKRASVVKRAIKELYNDFHTRITTSNQQHHQLQWTTIFDVSILLSLGRCIAFRACGLHSSVCTECICVLEMLRSSDLDWCNTCFRFIRICFHLSFSFVLLFFIISLVSVFFFQFQKNEMYLFFYILMYHFSPLISSTHALFQWNLPVTSR